MSNKYILCRPDAGLNDILCQIETVYQYAERTDRIVVVDTGYKNLAYFNDKFSNYFSSLSDRLVLDTDFIRNSLDSMSVVPSALKGRVTSYMPQWNHIPHHNFVDSETGTLISFDLTMHYDEDILVRHTSGGGRLSILALQKLVLREWVTLSLSQRINAIGRPFGAIHIRNTDQQTDYRQVVDQMIGSIILPVFIATDSLSCRQYCEKIFGSQNVIYFSELPEVEYPIHCNRNFRTPYQRNSESILDLLTIALSNEYYKIPVISSDGVETYSGFSNLAEDLINNSRVLISLLGNTGAAASIIKRVTAWQSRNR